MPAIGSTARPGPAAADLMTRPVIVFTAIVAIGYVETGLTGLLMSLFSAAHTRLSPLDKHAGATGTSAW